MRIVNGVEIKTMDDVKRAAAEANNLWFSPETMEYWQTQIVTGVYAGRYFVTSDITFDDERAYSIRELTDFGQIDSVTFQDHNSLDSVLSHVEALVV